MPDQRVLAIQAQEAQEAPFYRACGPSKLGLRYFNECLGTQEGVFGGARHPESLAATEESEGGGKEVTKGFGVYARNVRRKGQ